MLFFEISDPIKPSDFPELHRDWRRFANEYEKYTQEKLSYPVLTLFILNFRKKKSFVLMTWAHFPCMFEQGFT